VRAAANMADAWFMQRPVRPVRGLYIPVPNCPVPSAEVS